MALYLTNNRLAHASRATGGLVRNLARTALLCSALVATGAVVPLPFASVHADAQELRSGPRDPNAQLLLKADELIYNNDAEIVTARGNVQLDYDGYNVVADEVSYDQKTKRVRASGRVEILEPDGNRIFADEVDITDDFGDGFVNSLRVETPDNTRFAAESAERFAGQKTVFNHGVYTACEPCRDNPEKPPLWQIKAERVILNGVAKTVSYENATFELFGRPIAYLPYFSHADPSVKRKSGFLFPTIGHEDELGVYYRQAYFWNVDDTRDLTVTTTAYHLQGFLTQAEWRQQFNNGYYTLQVAGIRQWAPQEFDTAPDTTTTDRGLIATTGRFDLNPRWQVGWNLMTQSDSTFANTYGIDGYSAINLTNEVYLRGLNDRSYFDVSAYQFLVQGTNFQEQSQQALVHPVVDYNYVTNHAPSGGEVHLDVNVASLHRDDLSSVGTRTYGIDGRANRASVDLGWKSTWHSASGLSLTPSLSVRGDAIYASGETAAGSPMVDQGTHTRFMPTAALEARYPILATTEYSSHVFEPIAQILLRPDLAYTGIAPNEDAQSLVFDATNLFSHDKFSGYDRIESGVRANVGLRYSGLLNNGIAMAGTFGQSFHLSGDNPYQQADLVNAGVESGLETDRSDYVAAFSISNTTGLSFETKGRFDETNFDIHRGEAQLNYSTTEWSVSGRYAYIAAQPTYGTLNDRQEITAGGSVKLAEHWTAFGSATFDIQNDTFVSTTAGLSYADECYIMSLAFSENNSRYDTTEPDRTLRFKMSFRTLGDVEQSVNFDDVPGLQTTTE